MKQKKQKPTVRILMPGPPNGNRVAGTVNRLTKEELEKYAGNLPPLRPLPRRKKNA